MIDYYQYYQLNLQMNTTDILYEIVGDGDADGCFGVYLGEDKRNVTIIQLDKAADEKIGEIIANVDVKYKRNKNGLSLIKTDDKYQSIYKYLPPDFSGEIIYHSYNLDSLELIHKKSEKFSNKDGMKTALYSMIFKTSLNHIDEDNMIPDNIFLKLLEKAGINML